MAIDPTIPLSASGGGNLLQTLSGATQLRGVMQDQRANVAASQAYKNATDPVTGQIDYNALTAALSQGDAAYNLPKYQAQINEARNSAQAYDTGKLELAQKRIDMLSSGFGGLLAKSNFGQNDVMGLASQGIKLGLFTPEEAVAFTSDMPSDPAQIRDWAKQKYIGFSTNAERLKTIMPQMQTINTGAQQVVSAFDPLTGAPTGQNTAFTNQMSPEAATQPTQIFDPATGTMRTVTREQFAGLAGGQQPGGMPGAGGEFPGGGLGTGRMQQPAGAPGVQAAPALGQQTAAETTAKGAAESSLNLQAQADSAPQAIYQFQNMREALKDINTGPGTDWRTKAAAFATAISPEIAAKIGIDPESVSSYEQFKKYATQAAQSTLAGLGDGTDSKLASAVAANPGTNLSKLGNEHLIDVLIAGQRGIQAKNQAWQTSGLPPEQYNKFSTTWNKEIDPRIFAAQDMDAASRYKMLDSLTKREQEAFKASWLKARNAGIVQ